MSVAIKQSAIPTELELTEINEAPCISPLDDIGADAFQKNYRTKKKAGTASEILNQLPVITNSLYQNALTLSRNSCAYLQPLSDISQLKYENSTLYYKGFPATQAELSPLYTAWSESTKKLNFALLRALYGIILNEISDSLSEGKNKNTIITIYYPDFARKIGKSPNIGKSDVEEFVKNIRLFETVIGIIEDPSNGNGIFPVLLFRAYDVAKNTVSFSSPYMERVAQNIYKTSIRRNRNGSAMLKKNGEPQMLPAYSYLIGMDIVKEKNKTAVEIVCIIVALIEQAGDKVPHIRAKTIVNRIPLLQKSLEIQTTGNKNNLLKRAFTKAWQLLREKTSLDQIYKNIQLPDPEDTCAIPTASSLDMVFNFPHEGKCRNV